MLALITTKIQKKLKSESLRKFDICRFIVLWYEMNHLFLWIYFLIKYVNWYLKQRTRLTQKSCLISRLSISVHENIYMISNILIFSRLIVTFMIEYFFLNFNHVTALSLFVYASIIDLIDNYIARKYNLQTIVNIVINFITNKTFMIVTVACLTINSFMFNELSSIQSTMIKYSTNFFRLISLTCQFNSRSRC